MIGIQGATTLEDVTKSPADAEMSTTSTNSLQNKVVTGEINGIKDSLNADMNKILDYFTRHSKAYQNASLLYNGQFSQGSVITLSDSALNYEGLRIHNSNGGSSYISNASIFSDIHANTFGLVGSIFVLNLLILRVVPNTNYTQFTVLASAQVNLERTGITYFNTAAGDATWDIYGLSHTLND